MTKEEEKEPQSPATASPSPHCDHVPRAPVASPFLLFSSAAASHPPSCVRASKRETEFSDLDGSRHHCGPYSLRRSPSRPLSPIEIRVKFGEEEGGGGCGGEVAAAARGYDGEDSGWK